MCVSLYNPVVTHITLDSCRGMGEMGRSEAITYTYALFVCPSVNGLVESKNFCKEFGMRRVSITDLFPHSLTSNCHPLTVHPVITLVSWPFPWVSVISDLIKTFDFMYVNKSEKEEDRQRYSSS